MKPESYHYALEEKGLDSLQANIMHLKKRFYCLRMWKKYSSLNNHTCNLDIYYAWYNEEDDEIRIVNVCSAGWAPALPIIWIQGILNSIFSFLNLKRKKKQFDNNFSVAKLLWNTVQSDLRSLQKEQKCGEGGEASEWKDFFWNFQRFVFVQVGWVDRIEQGW